ncbi:hypothetical protein ABFS82_01G069700 [Erythranthe guttata]|uniref:ubiquitin-conjugating enzyme E2 5-like n=1 Tax=Erythranthe guttata TaxID=4155 RepID=UPI00064D9F74|nr:PREDICTED: ubiquitin-conjugating enzyme E2 5-like [Erythranthe guttata]|eukprot:XP_012854234.1 PREDICTED: ubiquitin-conjugating enzyme E2 5-like [Erythranthe guttata]
MDNRKEKDLKELMENGFEVDLSICRNNLFVVKLHGPKDSPYEGGVWRVRVSLPDEYPNKPPSITFASRIYHTNIHEASGLICLNVISEDWSPTYKLLNVFQYYLPQLLLSPNPEDPMNKIAAAKLEDNREAYNQFVRDHCQKHAMPAEENISSSAGKAGNTDDEEGKAGNTVDEESKAGNTNDEEDKAENTDDEEGKAGNTDDEGKAGNTNDEEGKAGKTDDEEGKAENTEDEEEKSGNTDEEGKAGNTGDQ